MNTATLRDEAFLLADIGVTYAHFCVEREPGLFSHVAVLECARYAGFVEVVRAYLETLLGPPPRHAAVAIANPIDGDRVSMTNRAWSFSIREAQRELHFETLLFVNDFTALAMSLPLLAASERRQVGPGQPSAESVIGLIGPGSGLGVSGLVPVGERWMTLASEGGHVGFAPGDELELQVLRHAWRTMPRVSAERLLSGPGIELIHDALRGSGAPLPLAEILRRDASAEDAVCSQAVDCFCGMLGAMASDLALTLGATGGIYIGGGIVPRLGERFDRSPFRARFESKGRLSGYVAEIPTFVLTASNLEFRGISSLLAQHLRTPGSATTLLDRVRTAREGLSPAERRVADFVLANPRTVLNEPIGAIATGAEVSQPTVIRFCRSLGFQGLADFKLKLGAGLSGTLPVQRTQVRRDDSIGDLCAKVVDNTVSAIVEFREHLNVDAVSRAIALLQRAQRVEFFAMGDAAAAAIDAQRKLLRLRVSAVAHTDPSTHAITAELLGRDTLAVFISTSGQAAELLQAAGVAASRGTPVLAITSGRSPLAQRADVCIAVEHGEDSRAFIAMISRILHLLVVDMVTVGLSVRRRPDGEDLALAGAPADALPPGQRAAAPGVLITHTE